MLSVESTVYHLGPHEEIAIHWAAQALPRPHLAELRESITQVGQQEHGKAVLVDDKPVLLDGVTRLLCCRELEREFSFVLIDLHEAPEEWVLNNLGLSRRDLNDSQRALIAAEFAIMLAPAAALRSRAGKRCDKNEAGRTHEKVAKLLNVRPARVRSAQKLIDMPEVRRLVSDFGLSLAKANKIRRLAEEPRSLAIEAAQRGDLATVDLLLSPETRLRTDVCDVPIPAILEDVFTASQKLSKLRDKALGLADEIEKLPDTSVRLLGDAPLRCRELAHLLDVARPAAVCPQCQGQRCVNCRDSGWLSYEELTDLGQKSLPSTIISDITSPSLHPLERTP
jgi:hypothetical protein